VSGYRKIDGVFNYSQPYYVCPFAGINDQNNNLLKDTNMVHAWISKKETRAARVLKIKKQVNRLVFSDIKGKSIHDTIELKKNEDVVSALFDPLEKVCVYSTRITVGDKSQPYNSGHVYLIELSDSRSKPVEIQTDQPEQFFFLDYGPSSSFLGVTNKGRVYEWKAFTTGLKPNFISQTPEPVVVSTIYTGPGTNNALFIGGENGKIFKWQPQQGMSAFFTKEGPRVTAISVSSNGKWIAAGNLFGDIQLWNMVIPQLPCINIYNGRKVNDALVSLHFSGNNNSLVKVSKDGYVYEIPLLMSSLVKRICDKQKFLEPKQWSTYIPNVSYKKLCQ
jgi:WD40 repeat protein